jgi:hypothetical protein
LDLLYKSGQNQCRSAGILTLLHIQAAGGVESGVEKSSGVEAKATCTTSVDEPISGPEKTSGTGAGAETEINRSISEQERASGAEASTDNGIAEPMSGQERASGAEAQADTEINKSMSEQEKVEKHVYRVLSSPLHHADVDGGVGSNTHISSLKRLSEAPLARPSRILKTTTESNGKTEQVEDIHPKLFLLLHSLLLHWTGVSNGKEETIRWVHVYVRVSRRCCTVGITRSPEVVSLTHLRRLDESTSKKPSPRRL